MKNFFVFFILFLFPGVFLFSQESTKRLYIDSLSTMLKKPNGKFWDAFKGAPDIMIVISTRSGKQWKPVYTSPVAKNRYYIRDVINTKLDIASGMELQIKVIDKDIARNDLIGEYILTVSESDLKTTQKRELQFGSVFSFVYFFTKYKTLDLTPEQKKRIAKIYENLNTVENSKDSDIANSSYMKDAQTELTALKTELPEYPSVDELDERYSKLLRGFNGIKVEEIVEKIKSLKVLYEIAAKRKLPKEQMYAHFENFRGLLAELQKLISLESGKKAYETWSKWLAEEEHSYAQVLMAKEIEDAKNKLTVILKDWEESQKVEGVPLEKLKQYANDAKPYVEILEKDIDLEEDSPHQEILNKYKTLSKTISDITKPPEKPGENKDNKDASPIPISLTISLTDDKDPIKVGETTTYTLEISNTSIKDATNLKIANVLPANCVLQEVKVEGMEGSLGYKQEEKRILFDTIPSFKVQATLIVKMTVKVESISKETEEITDIIEISCDELPSSVTEFENTNVLNK